ncbi:MAG TPA: sulfite exporter TauE/SafE family protein, partial [Syntrophobacteria bacterium]|nr:sulfite exporter TauE/SafE family protein [Syntrophobacteria bacterium]
MEIAIALTAIVHFLNNLFKLILVGRYTEKSVVLQFGVPAIIFAYLGARTLILLSGLNPLASYHVFGKPFEIT